MHTAALGLGSELSFSLGWGRATPKMVLVDLLETVRRYIHFGMSTMSFSTHITGYRSTGKGMLIRNGFR